MRSEGVNIGWLVAVVVAVLMLGACSSSDDSEGSARSVEQILTDASAAMAGVESASFDIEQSGASVFIDDGDQFGFEAAEGRFARPASAEAVITVDALGFTTQVGAIAIDGTLWFTNPLTGDWTEAPESFTFDPATLFDSEAGIPALLAESSSSATLVTSAADADGRNHVRTPVSAERVSILTGGLVDEPTEIDLWIDAATNLLDEAAFDLTIGDAVSTWSLGVADYDQPVTIAPPDVG